MRHTRFNDLSREETAALIFALFLPTAVLTASFISVYYDNAPKTETIKVFYVSHWDQASTVVEAYGVGKLKFQSYFELEVDHVYEITYIKSTSEDRWLILIDFEEIL